MAINHAELLAYLQAHYSTELAAGADGVIMALMTQTALETVTGSVSVSQFAIWAAAGPRTAIEDHAANKASPLRPSALTLKDFLAGSMPFFDLHLPALQATVAAWVGAGAITPEQSAALYAIAQRPQTVAERDGFASITEIDIRRAIWLDDGTRRT